MEHLQYVTTSTASGALTPKALVAVQVYVPMSVLLTTPMSRVGKLPSTLPPPSFLQASSASGLALEAHVSVTLSMPSTTGPPAEEDTVTFGGTANLKVVSVLKNADNLEGFEKVGSKLRARCAPDERQKQEFRGLCACQHASPCPNPVKHQALCEFVQFSDILCQRGKQ